MPTSSPDAPPPVVTGTPGPRPEPDAPAVRAQRVNEATTRDALRAVRQNLRDDLAAFDTMTAAQRVACQRRMLRAVLILTRAGLADYEGAGE